MDIGISTFTVVDTGISTFAVVDIGISTFASVAMTRSTIRVRLLFHRELRQNQQI